MFDCQASGGVAIAIISRTLLEATRLSLTYGSRRDSPPGATIVRAYADGQSARPSPAPGREQEHSRPAAQTLRRGWRQRARRVASGLTPVAPRRPRRAGLAYTGLTERLLPHYRSVGPTAHRSTARLPREANVVMVRAAHRARELHVGTEVAIASPHRLRMFRRRKRFPLSLYTDPPSGTGPPRRPTHPKRSWRRRWDTRPAAPPRPPTRARTCSSAAARSCSGGPTT